MQLRKGSPEIIWKSICKVTLQFTGGINTTKKKSAIKNNSFPPLSQFLIKVMFSRSLCSESHRVIKTSNDLD